MSGSGNSIPEVLVDSWKIALEENSKPGEDDLPRKIREFTECGDPYQRAQMTNEIFSFLHAQQLLSISQQLSKNCELLSEIRENLAGADQPRGWGFFKSVGALSLIGIGAIGTWVFTEWYGSPSSPTQ